MTFRAWAVAWVTCGSMLLLALNAFGEKPAETVPDGSPRAPVPQVREIWTPTAELDAVLARYPRAVALSREQLDALLRESRPKDPAAPRPPEEIVLRQVRFDGRLVSGTDGAGKTRVRVTADLQVESLSDRWAEVSLGLPGIALGTAELLDGPQSGAFLRKEISAGSVLAGASPDLKQTGPLLVEVQNGLPAALLIQGRGAHRLRLSFLLPVENAGGRSRILLPQTAGGAAEFLLHLPLNVRVKSPLPCVVQPDAAAGSVVRVMLPVAGSVKGETKQEDQNWLTWKSDNPPSAGTEIFNQETTLDYLIEENGIAVRLEVRLTSPLGRLPKSLRLPLPPGAQAVRLEEGAASRWELADGALRIEPAADDGEGRETALTVLFRLPLALDVGGGASKNALPLPEFSGAHSVTGRLAVRRGRDLQIWQLEPGPALRAKVGLFGRDAEANKDFIAGFAVSDLPPPGAAAPPVALTLDARKSAARFSVDVDTLADFQPSGINLERTLTFHVEQGEIFSARAVLPPGEELLAVSRPAGPEPDWRKEGGEVVLTWNAGLSANANASAAAPEVIKLRTRADLKAPAINAPSAFEVGAATVRGAERLTGYIALKSAPAFRLAAQTEDKLERRDGRSTPVHGDIAWFYRENFRLAVRVERLAAETEAKFVGYALPLSGAVEINAQIQYGFLFSGVESVKVRVPRETANAFYFTGDHIAERKLENDVWTIRFQGERTGDYTLGVRATLPCPAQSDDAARFHFQLPALIPLDAARWSGVWAVEANTDTEIRFAVAQANESDTLRAPELAGYQPQRRVIGVFDFIGGQNPAIDLDGVRHPSAGGAGAVVDDLRLETFVSTSGAVRHHATLSARTAGDQFFNIRLPKDAALWSLTLDGELIKPVGGPAGELRVELPGGRPPEAPSKVEVVYETRGKAWADVGQQSVLAPRFDPDVPVLKSVWRLCLPEGFSYKGFDSVLTPQAIPSERLLISRLGEASGYIALVPAAPFLRARKRSQATAVLSDARVIDGAMDQFAQQATPSATAMPAPPLADAELEKALQPKFIDRVHSVVTLFSEAQGFYDSGRYDLALKRYEQILSMDPSNIAAHKGIERVNAARIKYGDAAYDQQRSQAIWEVAKGWERPVRRFGLEADPHKGMSRGRESGKAAEVERWLSSIIVPKVEFRQTPLREAIEFLHQEARRLDTQSPPEQRGFSIFLKLPSTGATFRTAPSASGDASIPGLDLPSAPTASSAEPRITLTLSNVPLLEALRYVASQAGLKVKVEAYAVSIVPLAELTDALITSEFQVSSNFNVGSTRDVTGVGTVAINRQDVRAFLEANGVTFMPGASAAYLPSSGKLVVRNTQENIDLIDALLNQAEKTPSKQAANVVGLLPIKVELPVNGRVYEFTGNGVPGEVAFRYVDWRAASRRRWVGMTFGALAFLAFGAASARPWRRWLGGVLTLTFFPLIVAPGAAALCNALLAGWLLAALGWSVTRFLLRKRVRPATTAAMGLSAALLLPTGTASAAEKLPPTAPAPEVVIVPYDVSKPVAEQNPDRVYLPYERFLTLWEAAKRHRQPSAPEPPPGVARYVLSAARYEGKIVDDTLQVEGVIDFQTFGEGWAQIPLDFTGAQLAGLTLDNAPSSLGKDSLWVGQAGAHRVAVSLRLPAPRLAAGARLSWILPRTAATLFIVTYPQKELRASIYPSLGAMEEEVPEGQRLTAMLGVTDSVALSFRAAPPTVPAAASQPALAKVDSQLALGMRGESARAEIAFSFAGGSQDQFTAYLDRGFMLVDLDAPDVKSWRLTPGGDRQTLEVTLNAPARDSYRLSLTADRPIEALPAANRRYPYFFALASRVEQSAALLSDEPLEVSLPDGPPSGYRRVQRPKNADDSGWRSFGAYEFAGAAAPEAGLVYDVRPAVERREARINYLYQIGRGKIELAAAIRLSAPTSGSPILGADLHLPEDFAIQAVEGDRIKQWWREGDALALRFRAAEPGDETAPLTLLVYLVRQFERPPESFALRPIIAQGFAEASGEALVAADRSLKVGLALPQGARARDLAEINAQEAAGEFQVGPPLERQRAFRYRGAEFDATATLAPQPARWEAGWVGHATARDGFVSLQTRINLEVRQGAMETLEFSLPAAAPEARVTGPEIRESSSKADAASGRRVYRIAFQNPIYAETGLTLNVDLPLGADGKTALPDIAFPGDGARASGGFLLVENASSGEMSLNARALDPAVAADVPFLPPQFAAGTRFFRAAPGTDWALEVRLTNLEKTAGRAALVAYAELTSALRPSGEEWHRAVYRLQNRRLQFLPVELPTGMAFIGARVAGESVRVDAGKVEGRPALLVPLLKTRPGELSYDVEITYRRPPGKRLGIFARRSFDAPRLPGIPVEKTLWDVWLPGEFRLLTSGGNAEPALAALNETEKLESALTDLRSLSSVLASSASSAGERSLALGNFNRLYDYVSKAAVEGEAIVSRRAVSEAPAEEVSQLKSAEAQSQRFQMAKKKERILSEAAGANNVVQQLNVAPAAPPQADSPSQAGLSFDADLKPGSNTPANWRDNRAAQTGYINRENKSAANQSAGTVAGGLASGDKDQLALNDQVSVTLEARKPSAAQPFKQKDAVELTQQKRLSTARAAAQPLAQNQQVFSLVDPLPENQAPSQPGSGGSGGGGVGRDRARAPTPSLPTSRVFGAAGGAVAGPAALAAATPAPAVIARSAEPNAAAMNERQTKPQESDGQTKAEAANVKQTLRSTGRLSLAVEFPKEGQVSHFKKIKGDATLTLWAVKPAGFARLGWLVALGGLLALWMLLNRAWDTRRMRRRAAVVPV